jgi:hypothetical protein
MNNQGGETLGQSYHVLKSKECSYIEQMTLVIQHSELADKSVSQSVVSTNEVVFHDQSQLKNVYNLLSISCILETQSQQQSVLPNHKHCNGLNDRSVSRLSNSKI